MYHADSILDGQFRPVKYRTLWTYAYFRFVEYICTKSTVPRSELALAQFLQQQTRNGGVFHELSPQSIKTCILGNSHVKVELLYIYILFVRSPTK